MGSGAVCWMTDEARVPAGAEVEESPPPSSPCPDNLFPSRTWELLIETLREEARSCGPQQGAPGPQTAPRQPAELAHLVRGPVCAH